VPSERHAPFLCVWLGAETWRKRFAFGMNAVRRDSKLGCGEWGKAVVVGGVVVCIKKERGADVSAPLGV